MSVILISVFIVVLACCALLNLVMLPGNWVVVALVALYAWLGPDSPHLNLLFFIALIGMAVVGEVVEFLTQIWGAKKYGSSNKATLAGMIGAIAGAIFFAPFLFGIGAIFGALAGAWAGCYVGERLLAHRPQSEAVTAANGALVGRFLGMVVKLGLGITMVVLTASTIWPN